ncbi:ABC transporter substrate-binding protein [bacterium]|nr:MAG: ABC transporter substrate-binding protein [bacterium]
MERFRILILPAVFALVFLTCLTGCRGREGQGRAPDEFIVGLEGAPASLDPRYATDAYGVRIIPLLFNGLLTEEPSGALVPDLAERWENPDPLTHRLTLKKNVRFHDGSPFSSKDVKATFSYVMDPANGCPSAGSLKALSSVETPDGYTVVFRLKEPFVSFPYQLRQGILPERLAGKKDLGEELTGTGPFKLDRIKPGEEITLLPNPECYRGAPLVEGLRFRILGNATTRLLELKSGGIDLLQNAVPPYSVKFLEREENLKIIRAPGPSYQYLGFNLEDKIVGDAKVRRAIAHALDRKSLIEFVLQGQARPAKALFSPEHIAFAPGAEEIPFDLEEAKTLLDSAGYPDPDGDGPAMRFSLSYKTSSDKTANEVAQVIANQLRRAGIGVEVRSFEWGTFFGDVKKGNFQMMSLRWIGLTDPDVLHYIFHSSSVPPAGANRGRVRDAEIDAWLDASRSEPDFSKRMELYRKAQEKAASECYYVSLWWLDNVVVMNRGFDGFTPYPGGEYTSLAKVRRVR